MPIYRDKARGRFCFEFDARIGGERIRLTKLLPRSWNRAQADAFDRAETGKLYATARGLGSADHTIEDAVALYLRERVPELKHGRNVAKELAIVFWAYQGRPLAALADVCKAITLRSTREDSEEPLAPATLKNRIAYLRAACRYAWKTHAMGDADPGARISVPQVRNERHQYIGRAQMLRLARACTDKPTRAAIRIAFYSGMRLGEIERAEVVDGRFVLRDTKNGDPRIVPIHPRLNCCLKYELRTRFATNYHFVKARKAVAMPWLHFHDLRHSAASELINQGVDLYTVGAVLGHRSAASTKRYAHLATERLNDAILKIGKRA
jgi:integrase